MNVMKMKNLLIAGAWALAGLLIACSDDETTPDVAPSFPAPITAEVVAGDTYTFTIAPTTEWTLGLTESSMAYFNLLDDGLATYRLHNVAGSYEITVQVSAFEEFDTDRICEVWLRQGTGTLEETRTIVTLTRRAVNREMQLYIAEYDATSGDPDFVRDEENMLVYKPAGSKMEFIYDSYNHLYMQRWAVNANLTWSFQSLPAWFGTNEIEGGNEGRTEIFSRVNATAHPFEDTSFCLGFIDVSNPNAPREMATTLEVFLPGCDDVCYVDRVASSIDFNAAGAFDNNGVMVDTGVIGSLNAPMGARLMVAAKQGGSYTFDNEATAWITINEEQPTEASTEYGIWSRNFTLTAAVNEESAREAVLLAVPQSMMRTLGDPSELLTVDGTALVDESLLVSTLRQASGLPEDFEAIEAVDLEGLQQGWQSDFKRLTAGSWPWMGSWASIPYAYQLNYSTVDAIGDFYIHFDYASYRVFGFDGEYEEYTDLEHCWITLQEGQQEGTTRVKMRLGEEYTAADGSTKVYENPLAGDGGENEATIVFYDENGVAQALIYCILAPKSPTPDVEAGEVSFVDAEAAKAAGTYLEQIKPTDEDYDDELTGIAQYRVIFTKPNSVALKVPSYIYGQSYDTSWLEFAQTEDDTIAMLTASETTGGKSCYVSLYAAVTMMGYEYAAQLICIYDPDYTPKEESDEPTYDPAGAVTFADYEAATAAGMTLLAIPDTDDSYDKDMGYKGIPQYRLTMKQAGSVTLKVPAYYFGFQYSGGWLSFTPDWMENTTEVTITMESTGNTTQTANLTLYVNMSEGTIAAQIQCVLLNE